MLKQAEVQFLDIFSIFDCAKVELLQVYFRYSLNRLHLKGDITVFIKSDIKTQFRIINKKCALCKSNTPNTFSLFFYISRSRVICQ